MNQSKMLQAELSSIDNGTSKAGRDFIVQTDYDIYGIPPFSMVNKSYKVIYKNGHNRVF